jgi:iron complex outermembrane receptor protein
MSIRSQLMRGSMLAALTLTQMLGASAALAQTGVPQTDSPPAAAVDTPETIIVTGSRIRRSPIDLDQPTVFLDDTVIDRTGLSSTADVLQRLPSAAGGLNTRVNSSGNFGNPPEGSGVGAGSAEIDLRYLGARRTLVLLDGLRLTPGSAASGIPASVDLNIIPQSMIERIEVLQNGASPIYGSDAIAGVVNIITKESQRGFDASFQYGEYLGDGDGETQDYNLSWGAGNDRTNLVVGFSYVDQKDVSAADRSISQFPEPGATSCLAGGCSSFTPLGRFVVNNPLTGAGLNLTLNAPVTGRPRFDPANPTGPASDFKAFTDADRFNFAPFNLILTPSERIGGFISFKQEFTDNLNFRLKALYNNRKSKNEAAPLPIGVGPDAGFGNLLDRISIDATNPFNPFGVTLSAGGPGNPPANFGFVFRRLVEAGTRRYFQDVDTFYITGTLDGGFDLFGREWFWDASAVLGYNDAHQEFLGNVNSQRLQQALGPIANCTGGCVPFNFFGGVGSITPDQLAFVTYTERNRSSQRLQDYTLNLTGELFDLPGGAVGVALGYEHRDQKGSFDPDPITAAGFSSDIPALPSAGRFNVDEIYGEIRAPLLKDAPFAQELEASFAARHSNYSTFGGTTTFQAGLLWRPVDSLLFRGSWGEGFRAPGIGELFGTPSRFDQELTDPCSGLNATTPAAVRTNCIAQGVPANGSYVQANPQISVVTGGNRDLDPETSESWVVGAVFSPQGIRDSGWASDFSVEANYYDISVDGAIAPIGADVLLNRCAQNADPFSCASITRTASGAIVTINGLLQNITGIDTRGVDVTLNYRTPEFSAGQFGVYLSATRLLEYTESVPATTGTTPIEREGTERGSPDQAFPKWKAYGTVDWTLGEFGASVTGRYIDSVVETQAENNKLNSRFYTDVQVRWNPGIFDERVGLTLGVNNLFDKDPPGCISCGLNNFDPTTYDVPGRFGYVRLSYKM